MSRTRTAVILTACLGLLVGSALFALPPIHPGAASTPGVSPVDRHGDALPLGARARLGTIRFRQGTPSTFLAFAPDGKALLTSNGGLFVLWDTATGRRLRVLPGGSYGVTSTAYSLDSKSLTVVGRAGVLHVWDPATGKEIRRLAAAVKDLSLVALTRDGKTAALLGGNQLLRLWDLTADKELRRLTAPVNPQAGQQNFVGRMMAFSPDGKLLAVAGTRGQEVLVRFWDVESGRERPALARPSASLTCLAFSPDGKTLVLGEPGPAVLLLDLATGAKVRVQTELRSAAQGLAFAPDGKTLALINRPGIDLVECATGKLVRRFRGAPEVYFSVALSADGKTLAGGGSDNVIHLWDVATGKEIRPADGPRGPITAAVYAPDGKTVATASADHTIRLWDVATGRELRRLERPVRAATEQLPSGPPLLAFLRGGRAVAAAWPDGGVTVWETATGRPLPAGIRAAQGVRPLAFAPDGRALAVLGPDGLIRLRDVRSGRELRRFTAPSQPGPQGGGQLLAAFAPDGRTLALGTGGRSTNPYTSSTVPLHVWDGGVMGDGLVRLWELTSGRERGQLSLGASSSGVPIVFDTGRPINPGWGTLNVANPLTLLALSPDGRTLAAAVGGTLRLYDLDTNRELRRLDNVALTGGLAFSPDGRLLALGEMSGVSLWNPATGELLGRASGHWGAVQALRFAPDGESLVSGSDDTTALIWDVARLLEEGRRLRVEPSTQRLEQLWADLAAADADRAYRAMWALAAAPARSVSFLGARLKAVPPVDAAKVARLVASLDDPRYGVRQRAVSELEALGEIAEPNLRKVLEGEPSLELRRRVEGLLEKVEAPLTAPEKLRVLRAVEALERAGTAEARGVLERLARGAAGARQTDDARAAAQRLARRQGVKP
jgi:WD40 repeat protein